MIVLDTNVISSLMRSLPDMQVLSFLDSQPSDSIWTTSITLYEIRYGLGVMPRGRNQLRLQKAFEALLEEDLGHRILDFDSRAASSAAHTASKLHTAGKPIDIRDLMIAGITLAHRATLATGNLKHFQQTGIPLLSPWDAKS